MTKIALAIYHYFERNRLVMFVLLILSFIFFVFQGLKMTYEEDITRLLPQTKSDNGESLVFSNLKVKDKIYILFQPKADSVSPEQLAVYCDEYVETLTHNADSIAALSDDSIRYMADVLYKMDQSVMINALGYLMESIPSYVEDEDYAALDSMIQTQHISQKMAENYQMLFSPLGMMYKNVISRDPLGMKDSFVGKIGKVKDGLGGNYTLYEQHFFTPDTALAVAFISPGFASTDSKKSIKLVSMIEDGIKDFTALHPDVDIYYHGAPVQSVYNSRQTKKDLASTLSVSMLIICIAICFCFKNWDTLPMLLLPVVYGTFFALAVLYMMQGSMSLLALGIGGVVLGVALSYCLHVLVHYKYVSDPETVIKDQTTPVILGCLTTIGAFMSLMFTEAELLRDFGKFASLALVGTTFFSLIFLPHFFRPKSNEKNDKAFAMLEKINSYPFEKKTWLIISIVLMSIVCLITMRWVKFDTDLRNIGYNEPRVMESQQLLSSHSTEGYQTVYYATIASTLDSALTFNKTLYDELEYHKKNGNIQKYANSATLFVTEAEQMRRIAKWKEFWNGGANPRVQQVRNRIATEGAKYGFSLDMFDPFFEMITKDYTPTNLFESDALPSSMKSNLVEQSPDGKFILFTPVQMKVENKIEVTDAVVSREVDGKRHFVIIDPFYYTSELVRILNNDFTVTQIISGVFVFLVLLISFRSVVLALIGFVPMTLSWYIVQGVMAICGIEFNLVNIVISTFIYGIGVDYSIFIMDGLLSGFRTRKPLLVYHKTAILFSAFVLILGISSLMFATHPAMKSVGFSTLVGMSSTVIIAYSLQPFLFYWFIKRRTLHGKAPVTVYNLMHPKSFFRPDAMNSLVQLRNNYEYRGPEVESALKSDLAASTQYKVHIREVFAAQSMLDYGTGYGFLSYWYSLKNDDIEITAFDTNDEEMTIARNCYLNNDHRISFISDAGEISSSYDLILINKSIADANAKVQAAMKEAKAVVIRKEVKDDFSVDLITNGFTETDSDAIFVVYKRA